MAQTKGRKPDIVIEETENVDLDAWIDDDATFLQVQVPIYKNKALYAELAPLDEQITEAKTRVAHARSKAGVLADEETTDKAVLAAEAALDALCDQAEAVYARYESSRETWTLRAITQKEAAAIVEEIGLDPRQLGAPKRGAKESRARFEQRMRAYVEEHVHPYLEEYNERALAFATVQVETARGVQPGDKVTRATLRRLRARPYGEGHFARLVAAFGMVTLEEPEVPAPHRRGA